jgi:hypothetical protein
MLMMVFFAIIIYIRLEDWDAHCGSDDDGMGRLECPSE